MKTKSLFNSKITFVLICTALLASYFSVGLAEILAGQLFFISPFKSISCFLWLITDSSKFIIFSNLRHYLYFARITFFIIFFGQLALLWFTYDFITHRRKTSIFMTPKQLTNHTDLNINKREIKPLLVKEFTTNRLTVGRFSKRYLLATEDNHSLLVIGPTQSGKTSGFVIPVINEWDGPVIVTSVKTDVFEHSASTRSKKGPIFLFDFDNQINGPKSTWNFLKQCSNWQNSVIASRDFCNTGADLYWSTNNDSRFWYQAAAKILAPILYAGSLINAQPSDLLSWINRAEFSQVAETLQQYGNTQALESLVTLLSKDEKLQSSILMTLESSTEFFNDIPDPANHRELSLNDFLNCGTIYITTSVWSQKRYQAYFSLLINHIIEFCYNQYSLTNKPLYPSVLVVLDEAANIAPLPNLANIASTARAFGVQLVSIWHDLSQLQSIYKEKFSTVFNNHRAKVLLSGCSDPLTIETFSKLLGPKESVLTSKTTSKDGQFSITDSETKAETIRSELRQIKPYHGILLYGHYPAVSFQLRSTS